MKRKHISSVALVTGSLLLSSCGEVGRYQMVVTPPFEGQGRYWTPQCYVLDTKTGEVLTRIRKEDQMVKWDPVNRTLRYDSLTVTYLK